MKVTINLDMTPEEARKLMGLPDVSGLQEEMLEAMRERTLSSMDEMSDPEFLFKKVFPVGIQSMEAFQRMFSDFASSASNSDSADKD